MSIPTISTRPPNTPITPSAPSPSLMQRPKTISGNGNASNGPITKIITSKEWVLPPRPKPGRKPSADTPATKRKAQNRAAQRAFRERRANRVSELETQILELEREKSIKEGILTNNIKGLQNENELLKKSMSDLRASMEQMQKQMNSQLQSTSRASSRPSSQASTPQTQPSSQFKNVQPFQRRRRNTNSLSPTSIGSNPATPQSQSDYSATTNTQNSSTKSHSDELTEAASMMINFKNNSRAGSMSSGSNATSPLSFSSIAPPPNTATSARSSQIHHNRASSGFAYVQLSPVTSQGADSYSRKSSQTSQPSISTNNCNSSSNNNGNSNDDDDCGICMKDDCICESLGLKEKNNSVDVNKELFSFEDFTPVAAVPLKKKRSRENQEVDFTNKFKKFKSMPLFRRETNSSSASLENSMQQGVQNDSLFKSPYMSLSLNDEASPSIIRSRESTSGARKDGDNYESVLSPEDQCGFCSDDTPCVCREIAKQKELLQQKDNMLTSQLNENSSSVSVMKSENAEEVEDEKEIETEKQIAVCTGNPGTCQQCQKDPMSTLFCTTIASKSEQESAKKSSTASLSSLINDSSKSSSPLPPLPKSLSGSSVPSSITTSSSMLPTPPDLGTNSKSLLKGRSRSNSIVASNILPNPKGITLELNNPNKHFIPCADAYKTLSRHHNFPKAQFNSIISNLNTNGQLVEVESVVTCLRELDRKFGSN